MRENASFLYKNFEKVQNNGGQSHEEMRFKFMPLPHATEDKIGSTQISVESIGSFMFVNSFISEEKKTLAKEFLKFCYADDQLNKFHENMNIFKAVEYELQPASYEKLTYFGKSVYDYVRESGKFYQISSSEEFLNWLVLNQIKLRDVKVQNLIYYLIGIYIHFVLSTM